MHPQQIKRRLVLKAAGLGAVMLSSIAGPLLLSQQARAGLPPAAGNLAVFTTVSAALTGRGSLDPALAQALYQAFQLAVKDFDTTLLKLHGAINGKDITFSDEQKAEQSLSQSILQAWYLGVVGKGKKAVCVTYTEALANKVAAPILVPPSYSYGPIGTWTTKPE
ncbi:sugar dehydrogenase complex small subunit [Janthinobacterium sp. J1-1]|uniref:sugar dehydrogenase complex small subunit n=1 Tax=Janthinobacterium sp. J1-1 TaxID=3065910 RepID=UPI00281177B9|nr:sugar dehydrogenase complex small subunit [Janthinobacterium sp. J1-1]